MKDHKARVGFRCTEETKELIEQLADKNGLTITEYLLWLVENDKED